MKSKVKDLLRKIDFKDEEMVHIDGKARFTFHEHARSRGETLGIQVNVKKDSRVPVFSYYLPHTEPSEALEEYDLFLSNFDEIKWIINERRTKEREKLRELQKKHT